MEKEKLKRFPVGKLVAILIIALTAGSLVAPQLPFFLTAEQQQALAEFLKTHFIAVNPLASLESADFDPMRLVAPALLVAECRVVNLVIKLLATKTTFKSRYAETPKSLCGNCLKYAVVIFALVFGLPAPGINIVAVIICLGTLGLVVGFRAQSLIEDVITGFLIIFEG